MWQGRRIDWSAYAFVLPFVIPFVMFTALALVFGAYVAFTDWGIVAAPKWIGLDNFRQALTDPLARQAFTNTLRYALVVVPSVTILGFAFALYVDQRWPGHLFSRAAFYASNVVSAPVIGLVWVWILDPQFGLLNRYLGLHVPWLTSTTWAWVGVSMASVWWDLGLVFVLFLAGLQDISRDVKEAARVDGAGRWQTLRWIIIPLMRRTISLAVTLQLISTLRIFSQVHVMTAGGPANSSTSVVDYLYNYGINKFRLGYASAIGLMLFVVVMVITLVLRRILPEERT